MKMTKNQLVEVWTSTQNIIIIDVRTQQEVEQISIPKAVHVPIDELAIRLDELESFDEVYFFCRAGVRSQFACELAKSQNINAFSIPNSIFEIKEVATSIFGT
jgi:rhodanese-related sulfurtransferase